MGFFFFNIVSKVEQALQELDSQMDELRKVQEEQDVLAAKTAEVTIFLYCLSAAEAVLCTLYFL